MCLSRIPQRILGRMGMVIGISCDYWRNDVCDPRGAFYGRFFVQGIQRAHGVVIVAPSFQACSVSILQISFSLQSGSNMELMSVFGAVFVGGVGLIWYYYKCCFVKPKPCPQHEFDLERVLARLRPGGTVGAQKKSDDSWISSIESITQIVANEGFWVHVFTDRQCYWVDTEQYADGSGYYVKSLYARCPLLWDKDTRIQIIEGLYLIDWCGVVMKSPTSTISRFYQHPLCDFRDLTRLVFAYLQ